MSKRYRTEAQILEAIEHEKTRAGELLKQSELRRSEAKAFAKGGMVDDAALAFDEAKAYMRQSENIMDKKLKKLGQKLAQFRTTDCAFMDGTKGIGDASVSTKLSDL